MRMLIDGKSRFLVVATLLVAFFLVAVVAGTGAGACVLESGSDRDSFTCRGDYFLRGIFGFPVRSLPCWLAGPQGPVGIGLSSEERYSSLEQVVGAADGVEMVGEIFLVHI